MQDMSDEIVEAVHLMYEDDPQLEADCMLFLSKMNGNSREFRRMGCLASDRLVDMVRCTECGASLSARHKIVFDLARGEYYPDVYLYCPECGEVY